MKKILIVGAGISGIVLAERFAMVNYQVEIKEKRNCIGGNCFDYKNKEGLFIQKYGPHIFHTDYQDVYNYLSKFTQWIDYQHEVLGFIDGQLVPIPFNLNTLKFFFPNYETIEKKLIKKFGRESKIPILELRKTKDQDLKKIADFIYQKIFLNYTLKQWGLKPEQIDSSVTARVPVFISKDNRYFQDKYQGIPKQGFTAMLERMLKNNKIVVKLNTKYKPSLKDQKYDWVFYTGPMDEYFGYKFGKLAYRCIQIKLQTLNRKSYQPRAVVNYPNDYKFTRITEFKKLYKLKNNKTIIAREYPGTKGFKAYPILDEKNKKILKRYQSEVNKLKGKKIYFIGRLAEYKYYDMDEAIMNSLALFKQLS